ncbi:MAG: cupin domain-containing protein [Pseudomonadota bacterium]
MATSINGDQTVRATMHSADMEWSASPSGTVWRKRLHLVGPPEAGQVTSIVRYEPDSEFPRHDHPGGEEIFVLDGVFSDEHGDWSAGTYLLNPEGFRHTPFSKPGCLLFVKLRQFAGLDREHHVIQTDALPWLPTATEGVSEKLLYRQLPFTDEVRLERWEAGTTPGVRTYDGGAEYFVIDGRFENESGTYQKGSWLRLPPALPHQPCTQEGCTLYIKSGAARYLRQARD